MRGSGRRMSIHLLTRAHTRQEASVASEGIASMASGNGQHAAIGRTAGQLCEAQNIDLRAKRGRGIDGGCWGSRVGGGGGEGGGSCVKRKVESQKRPGN